VPGPPRLRPLRRHAAGGAQAARFPPFAATRRANLERAQLLVESSSRRDLQALLGEWLPKLYALKAPRDLFWHVEVDPLEL
jgi:primosomal protein N' (replication factor Y)